MKLSLKVNEKWLDFLDGLTEVNANDVMWQWMEIYLDKALSVRQSLWVTYTHKKYGEHTHEIMFAEDGTNKLAKDYIPPEVIRIPGEWSFQAFIRQYNTIDPTKYMQSATNKVTFTVASGLPLDGDGAPVTNATIGALYEEAKAIIEQGAGKSAYEIAVENGFEGSEEEWLELLKGGGADGLTTRQDENGDNYLFLTHEGEIIGEGVLLPKGGGGGAGPNVGDIELTSLSELQFIAAVGGTSSIRYSFTSNSTAKGTLKVYVDEALREIVSIDTGEKTLDISKYVVAGTTTIRINVTTSFGASASLEYLVTGVELKLSSTFNDAEAYTGDITFRYTVTGEVEKTVQFELDGDKLEPIIVNSSRQQVYTIPELSHGVHTLKVSASAVIDGTTLHSNELNFNIISYVSGNNTTIISSKFNTKNATQGDIISIDYVVFNPSSLTAPVNLKINGGIVQTLTVGRTRQYWNINDLVVGDNTLVIESGTVSKSFEISIAESDFKLEPVTDQLELYLDAFGRSNSEENRDVWTYGQCSAEFVDFNWSTNGWINNALRLNGKAKLNIPFNIFGKDFRDSGKTIEFEFATRDVATIDTIAIISYANSRGIRLKMNEALLQSEQSSVTTKYKDEERVRVSFVIEDKSGLRLIKTFINGVMSGLAQYPADDNFAQSTPVGITVNPEGGSIDLYTVRIYNIDLSDTDMLNNYVADLDVLADRKQVAAVNDILSAGEVSYAKVRSKIATVVITGTLPSVKGDKKDGKVSFEDPLNSSRNFEQNCVIDVQGTSSQFYPRKNWKLKLSTPIDFFVDGFEEDTYTIKVNYMESSNSHNTGIARYIHGDNGQIYTEKVPPQETNSNVRTVIDGEPIALFHRATETSTPKFYAIGDFNNDKGNANVLGLTSAYPNAESWEFKDNDELLCLFRTNDFSRNENAFEARYPDKNKNFSQIDAVVGWVYSTRNNLTKFRDEFELHFNLHYTLVYYVLTEMFGMVDSRAKNLFLNTWDGQIWYPVFYDLDTAFGLNNEGVNAFSYNIEYNDVIGTQNVYNGSSSVLWNNFKDAFADEIQELYTSFRSNGKLSYDKVLNALDEVTTPFSKALYNADGDAKYVGPLEEDNDATYLYVAQGDRREHLKWWLDKRFNYLDSKYQASDYASDYISMRLYSPTADLVIPFNGKFILKSFIAQYLSVRYGANAELIKVRANAEEETILQAREGADLNDKETTLYGASNIKDLGDLSNKYVGTLDVSSATKLSRLVVGNGTAGYSNTNLIFLDIGNNKLLTYLDVRNCPNLTQDIDVSGCENIKEIYATGTSTTAVKLAEGGNLETMTLPATITNLTVKNQPLLTNITMDGVANVSTLVVENVNSSIDVLTKNVLLNSQNLSRVRLIGFYWNFNTPSEIFEVLDKLNGVGGIDENNANTDKAILSGTFYIHSITLDDFEAIKTRYPEINLVYDVLGVKIKFYVGDVLFSEQVRAPGEAIFSPGVSPEKESTVEKEYHFAGWSLDGVNVVPSLGLAGEANINYYAVFDELPRPYRISFLNSDGTLLQLTTVPYGSIPEYKGSVPTDPSGDPDSSFNGWVPDIVAVTGEADYTAKYFTPPAFAYKLRSDNAGYNVSGIGSVTDTDIVIPSYYKGLPVVGISSSAFRNNTNLKSVVITDGITYIDTYAFMGCTSLTSIDIGNGVTNIYNGAFDGCTGLTSITIPTSVTNLSHRALANCSKLDTITMLPTTPPTIEVGTFENISSTAKIIVPAGCGDTYKSATNWANYASKIVEATE